MGMVKKILLVLVIALLALIVLQTVASESGEVVVVSTVDADNEPHDTRLWIVDADGVQYLRAGQAQSGWFSRLTANPRIAVERGSVRDAYDAVADPAMTARVNELMHAKYGWADEFIDLLFGREDATAIRLDPVPDET